MLIHLCGGREPCTCTVPAMAAHPAKPTYPIFAQFWPSHKPLFRTLHRVVSSSPYWLCSSYLLGLNSPGASPLLPLRGCLEPLVIAPVFGDPRWLRSGGSRLLFLSPVSFASTTSWPETPGLRGPGRENEQGKSARRGCSRQLAPFSGVAEEGVALIVRDLS